MILFHSSHTPLDIGTVLDPAWNKGRRDGWAAGLDHSEWSSLVAFMLGGQLKIQQLHEMDFVELLEHVRRTNFPMKPSQRDCVFACRTEADMDAYNSFGDGRSHVYRIRAAEDAVLHFGTWLQIGDPGLRVGPRSVNAAWQYWFCDHTANVEVLIGGRCEVVELVKINATSTDS